MGELIASIFLARRPSNVSRIDAAPHSLPATMRCLMVPCRRRAVKREANQSLHELLSVTALYPRIAIAAPAVRPYQTLVAGAGQHNGLIEDFGSATERRAAERITVLPKARIVHVAEAAGDVALAASFEAAYSWTSHCALQSRCGQGRGRCYEHRSGPLRLAA